MARAKTHKDVEYAVGDASGKQRIFRTFDEAAGFAVSMATSVGRPVLLDMLVWSVSGARFLGGDDAVESYSEDPDASVFERVVVTADALGRIP